MKKLVIVLFVIFPLVTLIGAPVIWSTPPDTLSSVNQNASDPQIAIDSSGNALAIWIENNGLKSRKKSVNGNWSSQTDILSNSGASSPKLVVDPSGNATAIWVENGIVNVSSMPFNGSWSNPVCLSGAGALSPQISVDSQGNIATVWSINGLIQSATKLFNGSWPMVPDTISSAGSIPQVAIGANGNVVAVWNAVTSGVYTIYSANKLVNGSWSASQAISSSSYNSIYPIIGVDLNGNAAAAWIQYTGSDINQSYLIIQSATMPMNGSWTLSTVAEGGIYNSTNPFGRILFDGSGNGIAIWDISSDGYSFSIQASTKLAPNAWGIPQNLGCGLYSFAADVSITSVGNIFIAYMYFDPNTASFVIQCTECDINANKQGFWTAPITISSGASNGYPRIAASYAGNGTNNMAVVWIQSDGTNDTVQSVTGTQSIVQPPMHLSLTQSCNDFFIFKEYYNTLSWEPSPSPEISYYLIFRNGFLIYAADSSVFQFIDHNRVQNGSVTYGIATVDQDNMQSLVAIISFP